MSLLSLPPRFFLDRSLGRKAVPETLRTDGWDFVTLAEHYGIPADQQVADTTWIQEAAERGRPILMKDKRIRYRPAEISAVITHGAVHHQQGRNSCFSLESRTIRWGRACAGRS